MTAWSNDAILFSNSLMKASSASSSNSCVAADTCLFTNCSLVDL